MKAIGNTPLIKLEKLSEPGSAEIYVKYEGANPTGSNDKHIPDGPGNIQCHHQQIPSFCPYSFYKIKNHKEKSKQQMKITGLAKISPYCINATHRNIF